MDKPSETVTQAWIGLMRARETAFRKVERALRHAEQPPYGWYDALWELEKAGTGGLRITDIETRMLVTQSNVSRLIDRLVAANCVTRAPCPDDGRVQRITITQHGRDVRVAMWPTYAAAIQAAFGDHLSDADARTVAEILRRIADA